MPNMMRAGGGVWWKKYNSTRLILHDEVNLLEILINWIQLTFCWMEQKDVFCGELGEDKTHISRAGVAQWGGEFSGEKNFSTLELEKV